MITETQKAFEGLCEVMSLVILPPEPLTKFQKGQAARIEKIYARLIELKAIHEWVTLGIFIESAKTWQAFKFYEETSILQRIV